METAEIQHSREMAQLDQLLVDQAAIIQAEFGTQEWLSQVNQSVLSVETAIGALEGSIAAAVAASSASSSAGGGGGGSSGSSNSGLTNEQIKQFADNAVAETVATGMRRVSLLAMQRLRLGLRPSSLPRRWGKMSRM
ncbi:hypothetical protein [Vreelandella lionensis]|uniref:hypothetical protein n=1 Tax=Vreelandella lionensis TaxID=1144478 RepID=UPI0009F2F999|nr:hypothetical protein [Halomonas lionensis]